MKTVEEVLEALVKKYESQLAAVLTEQVAGGEPVRVSLPLHPPTSADAAGGGTQIGEWIASWTRVGAPLDACVQWETIAWRRLGPQRLPARLTVVGGSVLADAVGREKDLDHLTTVSRAVNAALPGVEPECVANYVARKKAHARSLSRADVQIAASALAWFLENPHSGLRIRQVPVAGMHSKWLEHHRGFITGALALADPSQGKDLGLEAHPSQIYMAILDPALRPGGIREMRLSGAECAHVPVPRAVIVCENLQTVLGLPDMEGVIALHGNGTSVTEIFSIPWIGRVPIVYWGDIDAAGLRILDQARAHHDRVTSVLMDAQTLEDWRWVAGKEGAQTPATLTRLTEAEAALYAYTCESDVRLEQERISLDYALPRIRAALADLE